MSPAAFRGSQPQVPPWYGSEVASRTDVRRLMVPLAAVCVAVSVCVAWANRFHRVQQGVFSGRYVPLAGYLSGDAGPPEVIGYPMWGYPAVLALLGGPVPAIVAQLLLAVAAMLFVWMSVAPLLRDTRVLFVLCACAFPWWALASVRLADPWSACLGVIGTFALARTMSAGGLMWALLSAVSYGAAVNFRSEWLPIVIALPAGLAFVSRRRLREYWRRIAAVVTLTVVLLVPWGLFRAAHDVPFGLVSTNSGMVLYNSLGVPGNAWGIVPGDDLRQGEVHRALGPSTDALSPEGNRYLRHRFLRAVAERPLELIRKVAANAASTLVFGFYFVELEPLLAPEDAPWFELLKERLKSRVGLKVNPQDVAKLQREGMWTRPIPVRVWAVAGLRIGWAMLCSLYLLAVVWATVRLATRSRSRLSEPAVAVPLVAFWLVWALLCVVWYEPRQATVLYVLGLAPIAAAIDGRRTDGHRS